MAKFHQYMREANYLNDEQYRKVQAEQAAVRNSTFYSALVRSGVLPDETRVNIACNFFGCKKIEDAFNTEVDFAATDRVMEDIFHAIEAKMFVCRVDTKLTCIINDPENETLRNKAISALGETPEFALITEAQFAIFHQYQLSPRAISVQSTKIKTTGVAGLQKNIEDVGETESYTRKLLDMLLSAGMRYRASDLHLIPLNDGTAEVNLRIDGKMYHYAVVRADVLQNLRNILRAMSNVGGETPEKPVEGQITYTFENRTIDTRINIVKGKMGFSFCLRFIDSSIRNLEELGLSDANYERYMHLLHINKGLVIICGPTGSGKTLLMYAGLKQLREERKSIITIEDPVEIELPGATQMEVKEELGLTYESMIPSVLRADPDVVVIGETRTEKVAEQVIQGANTGHLLFTTLHTNDAISAISRLTYLGIKPYAIGDVLAAIIAQRLVRRVCTHCMEEYSLPLDHVWRKRYNLGDGPIRLKRASGCAHCSGTGYYGRIAVNEVVMTTPELRSAIQKGATHKELEDILRANGYQSYVDDAIDKAKAGITTFDEVDGLWRDIL